MPEIVPPIARPVAPDPFSRLDPSAALQRAVTDGNLHAVTAALARGADPNRGQVVTSRGGFPFLVHAIRERGNTSWPDYSKRSVVQQLDWLAIAERLLDAGADPAAATPGARDTVWHTAAENQDAEAIKVLLKKTMVGLNNRREDGCTPLHALARSSSSTDRFPSGAMRLVKAGVDLGITTARGSVLHEAMARCRVTKGKLYDTRNLMAWTQALVAAGLDLHLTNDKGETVMHWIAEHKRLDLAKVLWALPQAEGLMDVRGHAHNRTPWDMIPGWRHGPAWRQAWTQYERRMLLQAIEPILADEAPSLGPASPGGTEDAPVRRMPRRL